MRDSTENNPRYFHTWWRALAHELLLANLLPRHTAAIVVLDSPGSWAFNDGICEAQFSALGVRQQYPPV